MLYQIMYYYFVVLHGPWWIYQLNSDIVYHAKFLLTQHIMATASRIATFDSAHRNNYERQLARETGHIIHFSTMKVVIKFREIFYAP